MMDYVKDGRGISEKTGVSEGGPECGIADLLYHGELGCVMEGRIESQKVGDYLGRLKCVMEVLACVRILNEFINYKTVGYANLDHVCYRILH